MGFDNTKLDLKTLGVEKRYKDDSVLKAIVEFLL